MCRLFFHHHHHHQTRIVWFIKPASWRICASRCVCVFVCTPITHSLRQCCLLLCLLPNPFCFPFCWCQSGGCIVFAWIFLCLFWSISIGQIELVSSGRHARGTQLALVCTWLNRVAMCCSSCCFREPGMQRMHHHQQICLVYDSFASSSISLSLWRHSVYKKMIALVCLFVLWRLFLYATLFLLLLYLHILSPLFLATLHSSPRQCAFSQVALSSIYIISHSSSANEWHFFILLLIAYLTGKVVHFINRHLHLKKSSTAVENHWQWKEVKGSCK